MYILNFYRAPGSVYIQIKFEKLKLFQILLSIKHLIKFSDDINTVCYVQLTVYECYM